MTSVVTIERHIIDQERNFPEATGALTSILYDIALAAKQPRHLRLEKIGADQRRDHERGADQDEPDRERKVVQPLEHVGGSISAQRVAS